MHHIGKGWAENLAPLRENRGCVRSPQVCSPLAAQLTPKAPMYLQVGHGNT